jgi:phytanoyl-CoA hydroxylase
MRHWEKQTADLAHAFKLNGFVVVPNFVAGDALTTLTTTVDRYLKETAPRLPDTDVFYEDKADRTTIKQMQHMHRHEPYFAEFLHGRAAQLAEVLLGEPVAPQGVEYFNKPAKIGKPTPAHQDGYYFKLLPNHALTLWLALESVDAENGCVRYVQGSHRHGLRAHGRSGVLGFSQGMLDFPQPDDLAHAVACPAVAGDLLCHHSLTIHWAEGNKSPNRTRRAIGLVYYAASCQDDVVAKQAYHEQLHAELRASGKI